MATLEIASCIEHINRLRSNQNNHFSDTQSCIIHLDNLAKDNKLTFLVIRLQYSKDGQEEAGVIALSKVQIVEVFAV